MRHKELDKIMKHNALILLLAASTVAASAQTPAKPAAPAAAKHATSAAKPATPAKAALAPTANPNVAPLIKAPANIPPVKGIQKALFTLALRYQDIKVGDGAPAETGKMLKYKFTLWLAADGTKFDATDDHPGPPERDKDGKPVMGEDGKPKTGEPQPMPAVMGQGRPLPGWDMGVEGMKAGGIRRIFIPWQLGFGAHELPAHSATQPAVPAKSDLILQVELKEVSDAPQPQRPGMMGGMHPPMSSHPPMPGTPGAPPAPGAAPKPPASATPAAPPAPGAPPTAPKPAAPASTAAPAAAPAPAPAPAATAAPATPAPAAPAQPQSK